MRPTSRGKEKIICRSGRALPRLSESECAAQRVAVILNSNPRSNENSRNQTHPMSCLLTALFVQYKLSKQGVQNSTYSSSSFLRAGREVTPVDPRTILIFMTT